MSDERTGREERRLSSELPNQGLALDLSGQPDEDAIFY